MNRFAANPLLAGLARYLPGFGVVLHQGRKTHHTYHTPVCVFRYGSIYTIALTYGPGSDWVRNVLAHDGCLLETRGRKQPLSRPLVLYDEQRRNVPRIVRWLLGLGRVNHFLELRAA